MTDVLNVQDFQYGIEIYSETQITISSTVNKAGVITFDDNNNLLGSIIHSGANRIYSGTKTISGNIIIYDDINFVYITDSFDIDDIDKHFLIKPSHQIRYKINANRITNATVSGSKILTDLSASQPFYLTVNGREIDESKYTWDALGITLKSPYDNYLTLINDDIVLYTFGNNQTVANSLLLKYKSPQTLIPILSTLQDTNSYFSTYTTEMCKFDGFDISFDKSNNLINKLYQYMNFDEEVNRASTINISMFEDIRELIKDKQFRILAWDKNNENLTIFSNCILKNGANKNYKKFKNEINYVINFEDEMEIDYQGDYTAYGVSTYGSAIYGGVNYTIYNYQL